MGKEENASETAGEIIVYVLMGDRGKWERSSSSIDVEA